MPSHNEAQSDQDYIVSKSKLFETTNPSEAKSWLITAQLLFPKNYVIKFEAYNFEKKRENAKETARHLFSLFNQYPGEPALDQEMNELLGAVRAEPPLSSSQTFMNQVFNCLPEDVQKRMLEGCAKKACDSIGKCQILLVLMQKYPDTAPLHGVGLLESLLESERRSYPGDPVNPHRSLLVCSLLPLLLQNNGVNFALVQLKTILKVSLEYHFCSLFLQKKSTSAENKEELGDEVWTECLKIAELCGWRLGWTLTQSLNQNNKTAIWQKIFSYQSKGIANEEMSSEIAYCTAMLFLYALYGYIEKVEPNNLSGNASNVNGSLESSLVLVEGFGGGIGMKRKRGGEKVEPAVSVIPSTYSPSSQIVQNFVIAKNCWHLIHASSSMTDDFASVCNFILQGNFSWFRFFLVDILLYQSSYWDAIAEMSSRIKQQPDQLKIDPRLMIKLAGCHYALGEYDETVKKLLAIVDKLPPIDMNSSDGTSLFSCNQNRRSLYFLNFKPTCILAYTVKMLLNCLKEKVVLCQRDDDLALGHMLVLMQYDWPKEEELFLEVIGKIKEKGQFRYKGFLDFIINVDMLEEFMYLTTEQGGGIAIDILPQQALRRTISTRGAGKETREDFKAAIFCQMQRSAESLHGLMLSFLSQHREILLPFT